MKASRNPYVGPRAFQSGERLYGRDWEALELRDLIVAKRIVLLHSPSGAGKTSLIQSGLSPLLLQEGFQHTPPMRVGLDASPSLVEDLQQAGLDAGAQNRYVLSVLTSLGRSPSKRQVASRESAAVRLSAPLLRAPRKGQGAEGPAREVLVFDQFEEILTLDSTDIGVKEDFFAQLCEVLRDPSLYALFAMREEYVASLEPYLRFIPGQLSRRFRIDLLTADAALRAIQEPAKAAGVTFTDSAARKLVDDLRQVLVQLPDGTPDRQPGPYVEPVQLQVTCKRIWEKLGEGEGEINERHLDQIGDVDQALALYYEEQVQAVARKTGVGERALRDWFGKRLITEQGFRGQVQQGTEAEQGLKLAVIRELTNTYLVRQEKRRNVAWFELVHDRMVKPILRNNERWAEENLTPLQRKAATWLKDGRPKDALLRDAELAEAERWAEEYAGEVTSVERDFLEESLKARRADELARKEESDRRTNLADLGWGVVFAADDPNAAALCGALGELLAHRRGQAARLSKDYYKEFTGKDGYRGGETAQEFLARHGAGASSPSPEKVPYYLLIVGDPEAIPFEFQYALSTQYAVGRIHFDTPDEYAAYSRSIVLSESGEFSLPREVAVFSPVAPGDTATKLAFEKMVNPLVMRLEELQDWDVKPALKEEATKARLRRLLGGEATPALLFTASHGMGFPSGHPQQLGHQGALLCQDWPGLEHWAGRIPEDFYFAADDVGDDARLVGTMAFFFAEYSAGTPRFQDFSLEAPEPRQEAPRAFISSLPQRLLGHPNGGALAVIGHVGLAWVTSFLEHVSTGLEVQVISTFLTTLNRLMRGHTVGSAMEPFSQRYMAHASQLAEDLREVVFRNKARTRELDRKLLTTLDARNYVILGDPAARLPVGGGTVITERPRIRAESPGRRREQKPLKPPREDFAPAGRPKAPPAPRRAEKVLCNGLNGATGDYLLPHMSVEQISAIAQGGLQEPDMEELKVWYEEVLQSGPTGG
ncbi:MAG TPA: C25 family cysteine peptidase [Pyrinomonadaceae bacterium]|jgi:hypothetical protein